MQKYTLSQTHVNRKTQEVKPKRQEGDLPTMAYMFADAIATLRDFASNYGGVLEKTSYGAIYTDEDFIIILEIKIAEKFPPCDFPA